MNKLLMNKLFRLIIIYVLIGIGVALFTFMHYGFNIDAILYISIIFAIVGFVSSAIWFMFEVFKRRK